MPFLFALGIAAHLGGVSALLPGRDGKATGDAAAVSQPAYSDPLQRSVWTDGITAVRRVLNEPGYDDFQNSYVNVAAGHVVTLCGVVAGTAGYDGVSGERRFISVFGQIAATLLENNDASFGVLWNRVCARSPG